LNEVGSTDLVASSPSGSERSASAMNTYSARATPMALAPHSARASAFAGTASSYCVATVPQRIISRAIQTGAKTGPHHGSGSRKRMSQSNGDVGQWLMTRRKT